MRMRSLLLSLACALHFAAPSFGQVWLPDGTQIRTQRPAALPGFWDFALALAGLEGPSGGRAGSSMLMPNAFNMPPTVGWKEIPHLERLGPDGMRVQISPPTFLDTSWEKLALGYWNGQAYAFGRRIHPATDRALPSGQKELKLPLELWISRDLISWEPWARVTRGIADPFLQHGPSALLPLENGQYLALFSQDPNDSLALMDRRSDGELILKRWLDIGPGSPNITRSSKGILILSLAGKSHGEYWLLDNKDGHVLHRGTLERFRTGEAKFLAALSRPDGKVLMVSAHGWRDRVDPDLIRLIYRPAGQTPSTRMALGLLNARTVKNGQEDTFDWILDWFLLDPATGEQTSLAPPDGFPKQLSLSLRHLQFRDSQNLEW
jgi:hypothetical protein